MFQCSSIHCATPSPHPERPHFSAQILFPVPRKSIFFAECLSSKRASPFFLQTTLPQNEQAQSAGEKLSLKTGKSNLLAKKCPSKRGSAICYPKSLPRSEDVYFCHPPLIGFLPGCIAKQMCRIANAPGVRGRRESPSKVFVVRFGCRFPELLQRGYGLRTD